MSFEVNWQKLRGWNLANMFGLENVRKLSFLTSDDQRHILRDRRPSTVACPACWAMGTKELKLSTVRKKKFVLGLLKQPR
jgi:hypothetical protein